MKRRVLLHIRSKIDPIKQGVLEEMVEAGSLDGLATFPLRAEVKASSVADAYTKLEELVDEIRPSLILWEHPGETEVAEAIHRIRAIVPRIVIGYREADAYGVLRKRLPKGARELARLAHVVYPVGRGGLSFVFRLNGARRMKYFPNDASRDVFAAKTQGPSTAEPDFAVAMVANRSPRTNLGRGLPSSSRREELGVRLAKRFGHRFLLVGSGWSGIPGAVGPQPIEKIPDLLRKAVVTVGWNHFDRTPYYFSGRLVVCLLSGVPVINNWQPGYDKLFRSGQDLLLAKSVDRLIALVEEALDWDEEDLRDLGTNGRRLASRDFATEVIFPHIVGDLTKHLHNHD